MSTPITRPNTQGFTGVQMQDKERMVKVLNHMKLPKIGKTRNQIGNTFFLMWSTSSPVEHWDFILWIFWHFPNCSRLRSSWCAGCLQRIKTLRFAPQLLLSKYYPILPSPDSTNLTLFLWFSVSLQTLHATTMHLDHSTEK